MIRNGRTIPFPSEFATPPASSSQTGRGNCGLSPRRYAVTAFTRAKERNSESDVCLVTALVDAHTPLIDSSIKNEKRYGIRPGVSFAAISGTFPPANHYRGV